MFTDNPFASLSASIPPTAMQIYVVAMIVLVVIGTLYDMWHKRNAEYFFSSQRKTKVRARREVGGTERGWLAIQAGIEGLISGEFCNARRRMAHLLTMYGFMIYAVTTFIMVFWYPTPGVATPTILPQLWYVGALMICVGGYWFWFFMRVDVAAEGNPPLRVVHADLFILSLLASTTLALVWAILQATGSGASNVFLGLYLFATTVLFGSVPWSKFSHMFYKPAAAFQRRVEDASGSRNNLPAPADKPETFGSARRQPRHY